MLLASEVCEWSPKYINMERLKLTHPSRSHRYIGLLFQLVIPLLGRGVVLETHSQNVLVRVDKRANSVVGFAIRDMNGVKIHVQTLQNQGIAVDKRLAQISETRAASLEALWKRAHRTLIQNHAGFLMRSLGLDNSQGWSVVRDELEKVLFSPECPMGQELHRFFWAESMGYPCFLGAILRGKPLEVSFKCELQTKKEKILTGSSYSLR
jgi:siderophore synthetase component